MARPKRSLFPTKASRCEGWCAEIGLVDSRELILALSMQSGLSSGLKSIGKGVVTGVASLFAAPVIGATQEGAVGFAKGLAAGVLGVVVLPVAGVAIGCTQMVRGVINTPEAIVYASKGKMWDEEKREWVEKPDGAIVTAESQQESQRKVNAVFRKAKGEVDFYELLELQQDASPEQIKRQYCILAKKWHPDKKPGDEYAHAKFQQLGQAYQVLSNPQLREQYDRHGSEGLDVNFMDGGQFFNCLFGSDILEHLMGELMITAAARSGGRITSAEMKRMQHIRVEKIAFNLAATLSTFANNEEGFRHDLRVEAAKLVESSFGDTMLLAIGRVYDRESDIALSGFFGSLVGKFQSNAESVKSQFNAASAAIKVTQAQQKIQTWEKNHPPQAADEASSHQPPAQEGGQEEEKEEAQPSAPRLSPEEMAERQKLEDETLPLMLEAMWAANPTLKAVCHKVLNAEGLPKQELKSRALALREAGMIYQQVAIEKRQMQQVAVSSHEAEEAKKTMEDAMRKVQEKRMNQEA